MFNRLKRRSVLIIFFFIQLVLLSSYTFLHYQNSQSDNQIIKPEQPTLLHQPADLPASLIENSDRSSLDKNYKNPRIRHSKLKDDRLTNEKLQSLNVSFAKDIDQEQTVIKCPLLPTNLGNLSKYFLSIISFSF
jgi:hypothetical protein